MAGRLLRAVVPLDQPLTYLQLSGKTAYLPLVREDVTEMFPRTSIRRAADPKGCVVLGACLSRALASGASKRLILPASQRTTSRLGLLDEQSRRFLEIIPYDRPIPEAGLEAAMPRAWQGGREAVAIWENLGSEDSRVNPDGTGNTLLNRIGKWDPSETGSEAAGAEWTLRLVLTREFNLEVSAIGPEGRVMQFVRRSGGTA